MKFGNSSISFGKNSVFFPHFFKGCASVFGLGGKFKNRQKFVFVLNVML